MHQVSCAVRAAPERWMAVAISIPLSGFGAEVDAVRH
jgi:hypothetical protein